MFRRIALLACGVLLLAGCDRSAPPERPASSTVLRAAIPEAGATDQSAQADTAAIPPGPGIYGDVVAQNESGVMSGTELEIRGGPTPTINLTVCETGCTAINPVQYQIRGNALLAAYSEPRENGLGQPLQPSVRAFRLTRNGEDVTIEGNWLLGGTTVLKRLKTRYGLAVAEENQKEAELLARR